ncbi:MAG: DUF4956 domain-containing protein [Cyanobacteria bacterium P01_F01_bin.53]
MLIAVTLENLGLTEPAPLSIAALVVNLLLGAACAYLLSWHYVRFGKTNSNRAELAQVFPIVVMTTVLIISVVKSSLALSLGLVGALSIVRFRTPIKEPEELGYLFISISLGLGLGADQRNPTLLALAIILLILAVVRRIPGTPRVAKHMMYCNIELPLKGSATISDQTILDQGSQTGAGDRSSNDYANNNAFEQISQILAAHTRLVDMRRLDLRDGFLHGTYLINCQDNESLMALLASLQQQFPEASVSFVDQKGPLGI